MRGRRFLVRALMVVLLAAAFASCSDSPSSPTGPDRARLQLSTSVTSSVVPRGGSATVTFRIENRGTDVVTLTLPSGCRILPTISDRRTNRIVYPESGWACTAVITTLRLLPGESEWTDVQVRAADSAPFLWIPLPSGEYDVRASLATVDSEFRWDPVRLVVQ